MRLSLRSRSSVKHKSASVEFADQTGGRILTFRLEFNYKDRPKLLEARYTILRLFFMGLLSLCPCWRFPTSVWDCRTDVGEVALADWEIAIVHS